MLKNYFNITVTLEWITFFAAIILLNKSTGRWRLFIPWLFLVLIVETIGWYQSNVLKASFNAVPFNFLTIISISFFLWIMSKAGPLVKIRKYLYGGIVSFIVFAFVNLFVFQKLIVYNSITEVAGDVLLAFVSIYLIFELIKDESTDRSILRQEYFWLAIGVLFSAMGSGVLYTYLDELQAYYDETKINVYGYINYTVNALLYGCLLIAFYLRRQNALIEKDSQVLQLD